MSAIDPATLPPVLDVPTAGRLLGLGRSAAYELILAGPLADAGPATRAAAADTDRSVAGASRPRP